MTNYLLVTLDQFRADCLSVAGHPVVRTPHLDRLADLGVRFARHYSQAAPCSPGRASLYTGLYQMNHRVVGNGAPLDRRFDNMAKAARRAGYAPTLFGYTDQSVDPREADGPDDPRLQSYEGVLPGFDVGSRLAAGDPRAWLDWLVELGYPRFSDPDLALASEPERPAEHSMAAFLTNDLLAWLKAQDGPWFAHLSHFRPHPPYTAAGHFSTMYDPDQSPAPVAATQTPERLHAGLLRHPLMKAPDDAARMRELRAQYYGMISEVDHQLGRVWAALETLGQWEDTVVIVTADHGEQLGDQGLVQKAGYFEASYHILGIVRDPRRPEGHGRVVESFTENVDIFPTLCDLMGIETPAQCDGHPLTLFLDGGCPSEWRTAAHWEYDWRTGYIGSKPQIRGRDLRAERANLAVRRDHQGAYVHFGDGRALCFDLEADSSWRTAETRPARILEQAQAQLTWRAQHTERTLTGLLIEGGGKGRWPTLPPDWNARKPMVSIDEPLKPFTSLQALESHITAMAGVAGEAPGLSEIDHGLQCADVLAQAAPDDLELQIAGLVHDISHGQGHIRDHARIGAAAVRGLLGDRVADLVGLHVAAKRYIVTTQPGYGERLSPVSQKTFVLQGGDMTAEEVARFEAEPLYADALRLREADDLAKIPGKATKSLVDWLATLRDVSERAVVNPSRQA